MAKRTKGGNRVVKGADKPVDYQREGQKRIKSILKNKELLTNHQLINAIKDIKNLELDDFENLLKDLKNLNSSDMEYLSKYFEKFGIKDLKNSLESFPDESTFNELCDKVYKYFGIPKGEYCIRYETSFGVYANLYVRDHYFFIQNPIDGDTSEHFSMLKTDEGKWISRAESTFSYLREDHESPGNLLYSESFEPFSIVHKSIFYLALHDFLSRPASSYEIIPRDQFISV